MPLTSLSKNESQLRTSWLTGALELIPAEYRASATITVQEKKVPLDVLLADVQSGNVETRLLQQLNTERLLVMTQITQILSSLREYRITSEQQVETINKQLIQGSATAPTVTSLTSSGRVQDLGNGYYTKETGSVPAVFGGRTRRVEREDATPAEFRALSETTVTEETRAGSLSTPTLATGDLIRQIEEQTQYRIRELIRSRSVASLPKTLTDRDMNSQQQGFDVTKTHRLAGGANPTITATTEVARIRLLGDGTEIVESGGPSTLFPAEVRGVSRPDNIPQDFGALLETNVSEITTAGSISDPVLNAGELNKQISQETDLRVRQRTVSRDTASLPQSLTQRRLNTQQQGYDVVRTLRAAGGANPTISSTTEVAEVTPLGDGTEILQLGGPSQLFDAQGYEVRSSDNIPEMFKRALPITESSSVKAGTAVSAPTLSSGEIMARVQRQTAQRYVETRQSRAVPATQTILGYQVRTDFGGGLFNLVYKYGTLSALGAAVPQGINYVDVRLEPLGPSDGILTYAEFLDGSYPVIRKDAWDDFSRITWRETRQVVAANSFSTGVVGSTVTEEEQVDRWRSVKVIRSPKSFPTEQLIEIVTNHSFPAEVLSASVTGIVSYTVGATALGTADAGLLIDIVEGYSGAVQGRITRTFSASQPTIPSPTQFFPRASTVTLKWGWAATNVSARVWQFSIPSSLHGTLNFPGSSVGSGATGSVLPATSPSSLPHGSWIIKDAQIESYRGIWVKEVLEVLVP